MADLLPRHDEQTDNNKCPHCDSTVSKQYQRVMADPRTGRVRACPRCDKSVQRTYRHEG